MPIKVSVIVPVWNPGSYIDACVGSILDQTLGPDEVVSRCDERAIGRV